jgi:protein involved in polysaccharide export with SLBB domain
MCMKNRLALWVATLSMVVLPWGMSARAFAQAACDPNTSYCSPDQNTAQPAPTPETTVNDQGNAGGALTGVNPQGPVLAPAETPNYYDNLRAPNQPARPGEQYPNGAWRYQPPPPPTGFQRMVYASVGKLLPIFGENLFLQSPSTFAPVDQVPVTPDYVIAPGDQLLIRVWGQINFNAEVTVDRAGTVYLPQIGAVHVAGLPYSDVSRQLRASIGRIYKNFDLTVNLGQLRSVRIFLTGQARQPGTYTVSALSTLVSALFATGGPSPEGSLRHIELRRDGKTVVNLDLYDLLIRGDKSKDVPLISGDVIYIPPVGPQVAVYGNVRNPAIFELSGGESTVGQVIADAGGLSVTASVTRASLERLDPNQRQQALDISLDTAGMGTAVHTGDILRVLPISPAFEKTVTLRGNVADPGRFAWKPGMKLSDIIPNSQALVTRDYWQRRNQLGLPSPYFQADYTQRFSSYAPNRNQPGVNQPYLRNGQQPQAQQPSQAQQQMQAQQQPQYQDQNGYQQPLAATSPAGGDIGQALNGGTDIGQAVNGQPAPGSTVATTTQRNQVLGGSTLGEQQQRTRTENTASATEITRVSLPAPEIDWSYAVIERFNPTTLRTELIPFDPGKLVLDHQASQDLTLQPGDVVTIFSQADIHVPQSEQTKIVRLEGEVVHAGYYTVQPGETLRQLVERAGGFTPNAYLFGSELTRESTRVIQQQRVNDYVAQLELEIDRAGARSAAGAISPQDQAAASASLSATQLLISRLRQLRATGRIVLNIAPTASSPMDLPAIAMEDGDRFIVPTRPSSVNVVGAVYDQNSFLFDGRRRVKGYLQEAGGANRDADSKHAFLIRADGSVISRDATASAWGNTFDSIRLDPGDTIVVPEKVYHGSSARNIINYSQIFSSLAFGATALVFLGL